ncbi:MULTISPECIES: YoaK family protein [Plesiomonas]|uniref:YoaK family protein n=1 Tax=Plesiomonas TaxID=702 RepID=UPI000D120913|nr:MULTISPECIES: YoaK family protein [Plesiomonas]MCX9457486.1 DUF1275 domain-containing protein [Vibrio cholerae]AVQ85955.1 DUF1275 domain-containing protein [Plesiomonas shigelloides]KAB7674120.1 DUF1275 domain-containing protein [Plesiomonas shigelloides]KAB7687845.1 DUF1275 domain-containing protein [Plesiomonas shigelloides]MCE5163275.1 DUF1275 domain-containing protein [Plesiomonas sp. PI-19]
MKKLSIYSSVNHEIHYIMSFIGGSVEIVSFIYLYKALIGYMTSNMIFGVAALAKGTLDFESFYHISIIVIWMVIAAIHQLLANKFDSYLKTPWHMYAISLTINCVLLITFIALGRFMMVTGALGTGPSPTVIPLITIGLLFMYVHNFVIKHGGTRQPTATSVVTTVYVLMMTSFFKSFNKKLSDTERSDFRKEGSHYLLVILHFFAGAMMTAILSKHYGFYSLVPAAIILIAFTVRIWRVHAKSCENAC